MRILLEIPYADFSVRIYKMGDTYILNAVRGQFEQSYKISSGNFMADDVNEVVKLLTEDFIISIRANFISMHKSFSQAFQGYAYM